MKSDQTATKLCTYKYAIKTGVADFTNNKFVDDFTVGENYTITSWIKNDYTKKMIRHKW